MDRTESTVCNMLAAIEAPLYDVGVLSDRGMLPSLDGISGDAVIGQLSLLKNRNVRGSHIHIRPSGEHRYSVLDDLSEISLAKLTADGFAPCAVVETSAGNFQAWLKHPATLPKLLGTIASQTLAARYDADLSAASWRRFGLFTMFPAGPPGAGLILLRLCATAMVVGYALCVGGTVPNWVFFVLWPVAGFLVAGLMTPFA